ncbi:hypothetical protein BC833DRAFT_611254 [Globomyces pollinis-pini]|nr:hypothetical protein BC833DRAFT_611254 [Globomyces pollinis-pini]
MTTTIHVRALYDYEPVTEQELRFQVGDTFQVLNDEDTDWWLALHDKTGVEGFIPSNYVEALKSVNNGESNETPALVGSDDGTESVSESDPEYSESASNSESESAEESDEDKDDVKQLLTGLRKRKSQMYQNHRGLKLVIPEKKSDNDGLPLGFRFSTLSKNYDLGLGHAQHYLVPELSTNELSFRDLHLQPKQKLRKRVVKCNLGFSILSAKNVSPTNPLAVVGRHVRMALFDKVNIVSNIHSIPATTPPDNENIWKFSAKNLLFNQIDQDSGCFLRTIDVDIKLCLLFELCLVVKNTLDDKSKPEISEISCGWSLLPLFSLDGKQILPKKYEMQLFGGTPFENDTPLLESPSRGSPFLARFVTPFTTPILTVQVWKLKKKAIEKLNDLPDVFVGNFSQISSLSFYRQILVNSLVGTGKENTLGPRFEPALALIPKYLEQYDLMNFFVTIWNRKLKSLPNSEKRSFSKLKRHFNQTALTIWPLLNIDMAKFIPGHFENLGLRYEQWCTLMEMGVVAYLSKPGLYFKPMNINELQYHYLDSYGKSNLCLKPVKIEQKTLY